MGSELQSYLETAAVHPVIHVPEGMPIIPMIAVTTVKIDEKTQLRIVKIRGCVCGNFQEKNPFELLYTANIDIASIRLILSEVAQRRELTAWM